MRIELRKQRRLLRLLGHSDLHRLESARPQNRALFYLHHTTLSEAFMITISDEAKRNIDAYFQDKEKSSIRIYLNQGGCSGPFLGLALDEATDADSSVELAGFDFVVEKNLLADASPIHIDMGPMGFRLTSSLVLPQGGCGGGCGGGSSSGCAC